MDPSHIDQLQVALEAYQELREELRGLPDPVPAAPGLPEMPDLASLLQELDPLPAETLFVGMAGDGAPLLHRLEIGSGASRQAASPLLIAGDEGSGKTAFLQMLARSLDFLPGADNVQFGVVTEYPEEWEEIDASPSCLGIWPGRHPSARYFLVQLVAWAESFRKGHNYVLLLLDNLGLYANAAPEVQHDLRYLLMYGPEHGVWPVVTVNAGKAVAMKYWLDYFKTRIFARIARPDLIEALTGGPQEELAGLLPGMQYALQRPDGWLPFWIPAPAVEEEE